MRSTIIRVFGGVDVVVDGETVVIGGPRQHRLLALLVMRAGRAADIDWLAEYLWDDDDRPDEPEPALRTYVSRLRRSLTGAAGIVISTTPGGYCLSTDGVEIEHLRFSDLQLQAREARERGDPTGAKPLLAAALRMWRGRPFPELDHVPPARAETERLASDRLEMTEELFEVDLALGRHTQIVGELGAYTREHGLRERAQRQYALALHRSGRTAEALRALHAYRRELSEMTGLDPSREMVELESMLVAGEPTVDAAQLGRSLRGYRLLEQIGSGTFSLVWRGIQPSVDREVAIKQIRAELATQPAFIRRFEAEAQIVARIEHPHVVPLIDFWRDPDSAYLVMRWLRGGTLEDALADGPWPLDRTLVMAAEIGDALSVAHASGVIHGDVKSANILFDDQRYSYLSDFGIAHDALHPAGAEAALSHGSPAYASPEQLRKQPLGPAADLFSLAVVIYECLAGALPFPEGIGASEYVRRQINEPFPLLSTRRHDIPAAVGDAVARATAKDPNDRFATVEEFLDALQRTTRGASGAIASVRSTAVNGVVSNPYLGLRAFSEPDAGQFFGRDRLVAEVVHGLSGTDVTSRCVVLVGPSGAGKSSVARAGVVPAIRAGRVPGSDAWFTTSMVPGAEPFDALAAALLQVAIAPPPSMAEQLREGPRGILRGARRCVSNDEQRILLVIDQLEELFTHGDGQRAASFLTALAVAVEDPTTPLRVVATLRADFYDRPLRHPTFARILKATATEVTPLAPDELEEAIVAPAQRVGVDFEGGLVARLAAEAVGQAAPLPLLQHTLAQLFDRRTAATISTEVYDELGGLAGGLAAHAENVFQRCTPDEQAAVRRLFGRLADPGATHDAIRRRVPLAEFASDASTALAVDRFVAARLLTRDRDPGTREPTIEVAHEALLREWPRLAAWLAADGDLLRELDRLSVAAGTWDEAGRLESDLLRGGRLEHAISLAEDVPDRLRRVDHELIGASRQRADEEAEAERHRLHRLRRLVTGTAAALVVAVVAATVAIVQRDRADDEAARARSAAQEASIEAARAETATAESYVQTLISRSAALAEDDPALSILLALEAHRRAPNDETERAVLSALVNRRELVSVHPPFVGPGETCDNDGPMSPDGRSQYATLGGRMVVHDIRSGRSTDVGAHPFGCGLWWGTGEGDRFVAIPTDGSAVQLGRLTNEGADTQTELRPGQLRTITYDGSTGERLWISIDRGDDTGGTGQLFDAGTGEAVGGEVGNLVNSGSAFSPDGSLLTVSSGTTDVPNGRGPLLLLDARTGNVLWQRELPTRAIAFAFDMEARQLVLGTLSGRVMTISLEDGSVLHDVAGPTTTDVLSLDLRPDGRLIALTSGTVAVVERDSGVAAGSTLPLRNAVEGVLADDGTYVVHYDDHSNRIFDLQRGALVTDSFETSSFGYQRIAGGAVTALDILTGELTLIDLETRDRRSFTLRDEQGEPFVAVAVAPRSPERFATFSTDLTLAAWEEGRLVGQVRPDVPPPPFALLAAGGGYPDRAVLVATHRDGTGSAHLYDTDPPTVLASVGLERPPATGYPAPDGGLYVMMHDGELRHYDSDGIVVGRIFTERFGQRWLDAMPDGDRMVFGGPQGLSVVELSTGEVDHIAAGAVVSILMVPSTDQAIVTTADGVHRLWDLEDASDVVLFDGGGVVGKSGLEEDGRHAWLVTPGRVVRVAITPDAWIERACNVVGRELTAAEWEQHVPGDLSRVPACS